MKTAMVAGATGLIGRHLIEQLLENKQYNVIALVRNSLNLQHERLTVLQVDFDNLKQPLPVADELFCCLGTTIKSAGSKPAFYKVDYEYVLSIAQLAYANGTKKFAMISSMGADKNSSIFYNKTKGAIEEAVSRIGFETLFIFRPSLLLGNRSSFRLGETIAKLLMTTFAFAIPKKYRAIHASQVAKAMINSMNSGKTGIQILESGAIATM